MELRRVPVALVAASVMVVGLAAPVSAGDTSGRTTITMRVADCEGCTIQPVLERIDADGVGATYSGATVTVRNGVAVMRVPTDKTPGMSFRIDGPRREDINAGPVIVTQYKGFAPGTVVTPAQARKAKQASGCWVGTSAASVTLEVRTMTVLMDKFPPDGPGKTRVTTGWLVPTVKAPGNFDPTFKGVIAVQDIGWPCNAG